MELNMLDIWSIERFAAKGIIVDLIPHVIVLLPPLDVQLDTQNQ